MKKIAAGIMLTSIVLTAVLIGTLSTKTVEKAEHGRVFTSAQKF